jgi:polyphosphate glucokinase
MEAEHRASARVKTDLGLGWGEWAAAVNEVLAAYHRLLWPDVFVIGGGVTENWEKFGPLLESRAEILPAHFRNEAGIIGAAMAAAALPIGKVQ